MHAIAATTEDITMADPQVYLEKLSAFSRMLRHEGLSASPQETADACRILLEIGFENKSLVREALGDEKADVRTVHRLDRVVSGVMVLARNAKAASELSRQIREDEFEKEYLAVIHGMPEKQSGTLVDLLYRDKARRMTMVAQEPAKGVQEAILD